MPSKELKFVALASIYSGEKAELFSRALNSVINQSLSIPIALVIDGPLSQSLERIIEAKSPHIEHIFRLEKNCGLGIALQFGLEQLSADYDYVVRFDTDDENQPDRFLRTINKIKQENLDLVSAHMKEFSSGQPEKLVGFRKVPIRREQLLGSIHKRNPFNHPAVAFRISSALAAGGYRHKPFFEDWYLWARMIKGGALVGNIDEDLVNFTGGISAMSRRRGIGYAKHEISFYYSLYKIGLPGRWSIFIILPIRVFTRLLGYRLFSIIYTRLRRR